MEGLRQALQRAHRRIVLSRLEPGEVLPADLGLVATVAWLSPVASRRSFNRFPI